MEDQTLLNQGAVGEAVVVDPDQETVDDVLDREIEIDVDDRGKASLKINFVFPCSHPFKKSCRR